MGKVANHPVFLSQDPTARTGSPETVSDLLGCPVPTRALQLPTGAVVSGLTPGAGPCTDVAPVHPASIPQPSSHSGCFFREPPIPSILVLEVWG